MIGVIIAAALTLPQASAWRRPKRVVAVIAILMALAGGAFVLGSNVRNQAAADLGFSSSGAQLFQLDKQVPVIVGRLDFGPPLNYAVKLQDNTVLKKAVSWTSQLQAFIPRFLWSDKPIVDYGHEIAAIVYGDTTGLTSNGLTSTGDMLINSGIPGVIASAVLLAVLLTFLERRIRNHPGPIALILAAGLAHAVQAWEAAPLILTVIGLSRNLLVTLVLWRVSQAVHLSKPTTSPPHTLMRTIGRSPIISS